MVACLDRAGFLVHGMVAFLGAAHNLSVAYGLNESLYGDRVFRRTAELGLGTLGTFFSLDVFWPVDPR